MAMYIKGSFFAARRDHLIREFGDYAWLRLENQLRRESALFRGPITPSTQVPFDDYVRFQEAWLEAFYGGDTLEYWNMGRTLAGWALVRGPYRHLLGSSGESGSYGEGAELRRLGRILGRLWRVYSDVGELVVELPTAAAKAESSSGAKEVLGVEILDVPRWHLSVEYTAMGFAEKTVELALGRVARPRRLRGDAEAHLGCRYRFELGAVEDGRVLARSGRADSDAITRRARAVRL